MLLLVGSSFIGNAPDPADDESIDEAIEILMGCALVAKYIPPGVKYNNLPLNNIGDKNTDIQKEAINITDRMVSWANDCWRSGLCDWIIINPVNGNCMRNNGSQAPDCSPNTGSGNFSHLSTGVAVAANAITGKTTYIPASGNSIVWLLIPGALEILDIGVADDPTYKSLQIAAIGDSWINTSDAMFNMTEPRCDVPCSSSSLPGLPFFYQHTAIILSLLKSEGNAVSNQRYECMLNAAPCTGPYNYGNGNFGNVYWSSTNELRNPLDADPSVGGNGIGGNTGEYPGLDYMFLFNLYSLYNQNYLYPFSTYPDFFPSNYPSSSVPLEYYNQMDRNISVDFPYGFVGIKNFNPIEIDAFENIIANNRLVSTSFSADITYRAGKEIELKDGFSVSEGAEFGAYVKPFNCATTSSDYSRIITDTTKQPKPFNHPTSYIYYADEGKYFHHPLVSSSMVQNSKTKITSLQSAITITITPNPSTGLFTLQLPQDAAQTQGAKDGSALLTTGVTIYNDLGQEIYKSAISNPQSAIDISNQPKGIYFMRVQSESKVYTEKVVIQ
ncbi:MAG: T9SS type A sorting domain-containing protein [Bacteroidetes bacterium]|nr:T9SS type A sorting domain-containing protein [Bacteroidota bacterium]